MRVWLKPITVKDMSSTEAAWLAGMIDGEGTLCTTPGGRDRRYRSTILAVYNNHLPTVKHCAKITGTGSILVKPSKGRKNPGYHWRITSQRNIVKLLEQVVPYMITKKSKAKAFLKSWRDLGLRDVA